MYLQLKFNNPTAGSTVNIYRGDAELDRTNLSNPVATLSNGETTWRDNNVVRGKFYYYVFETVLGTDKISTINFRIQATVRRGAGPSAIQVGDTDYGYFGSIESSEFINPSDLAGKVGFSAGTQTTNVVTWHKFIRNGKVLYIPNGTIRQSIGWKSLYDAGLVFGVDGPGPYNAGADVNQKKTVTIGPDTYMVRLMRGYNDDYTVFASTTSVNEPIEPFTCEWDDLVYPLYQYVPVAQRMANVASYTREQLRLQNQYANWVQEKATSAASSSALRRGAPAVGRNAVATRTGDSYAAAGTPYGWWPVLELIES